MNCEESVYRGTSQTSDLHVGSRGGILAYVTHDLKETATFLSI
jgi:hypothetical protein